MIVEINITHLTLDWAQKKADELGLLRNSITAGQGNLAGFVGERVVQLYLGAEENNTYNFDLTKDGVKYDVKTKRCTSPPKPFYECSVAAYNTRQLCDAYIFARWCDKKVWLLGWMPKSEYYERAVFLRAGDYDPSNRFYVKADCYNLPISELNPIQILRQQKTPE